MAGHNGISLATVHEIEGEREFLLRFVMDWNEELRLDGASASALVVAAVRGGDPLRVPHDLGDLGRCESAYTAAPPRLQERMLPILESWRDDLKDSKY